MVLLKIRELKARDIVIGWFLGDWVKLLKIKKIVKRVKKLFLGCCVCKKNVRNLQAKGWLTMGYVKPLRLSSFSFSQVKVRHFFSEIWWTIIVRMHRKWIIISFMCESIWVKKWIKRYIEKTTDRKWRYTDESDGDILAGVFADLEG